MPELIYDDFKERRINIGQKSSGRGEFANLFFYSALVYSQL